MFCKKCGRELKDGQSFCPGCGTRAMTEHMTEGSVGSTSQVVATGSRVASGGAQMLSGGARAATGIAGTKLLIIIAAALLAIMAMIYVLFIKSSTPEDTVAKLETALNDLDQDEILDCFDEQMQDLYSGLLSVGGDLAGVDGEGLSDLIDGLGGIMADNGLAPEFRIEVLDVSYSGKDSCNVSVRMYMTYAGETESEDGVLPMKKEGREWKISMSALTGV